MANTPDFKFIPFNDDTTRPQPPPDQQGIQEPQRDRATSSTTIDDAPAAHDNDEMRGEQQDGDGDNHDGNPGGDMDVGNVRAGPSERGPNREPEEHRGHCESKSRTDGGKAALASETWKGCHTITTTRPDLRVHTDDFTGLLRLFEPQDREHMKEIHNDIESIILQIGGDTRKYHRERKAQTKAIISEIYSAPRVTRMATRKPRYGCSPGLAMDLTTNDDEGNPWDFSLPHMRDKAERLLDLERPLFLIGSPMCTAFSR